MSNEIVQETNIVYLKDYKRPEEPNNPEIVPDDWNSGYSEYLDDVSISVTFDLTNILEEYGFDIRDVPGVGYDLMMVIESIKSMMYRTTEEYYPLQDISEELFEIEDEEALVTGFLDGE